MLLGSLCLIHHIGNPNLAAVDKFWRASLRLQGFPPQEIEHRQPVLFSGAEQSFSPSLPYPTKIPWHSPHSRELGSGWLWCHCAPDWPKHGHKSAALGSAVPQSSPAGATNFTVSPEPPRPLLKCCLANRIIKSLNRTII